MSSGDSGAEGIQQQAAAERQKKAEARNAINKLFGYGEEDVFEERVVGGHGMRGDPSNFGQSSRGGTVRQKVKVGTRPAPENAAVLAERGKLYDKVRGDTFAFHKDELDDQATDLAKQLKFALLRTGNYAGSGDIDARAQADKDYRKGLVTVGTLADTAGSETRRSDEAARLDLLSRIDSGMDQSSAISAALQQLATAGERQLNQAKGQTLGDVFTSVALLNEARDVGDARTRARENVDKWLNAVTPGTGVPRYQGRTTG